MPIRLIALDLDGTLLNSQGELSRRNEQTIAEARRRGVRVALVTGRRFRDARPLALALGLDVPLIAHNGALTKHARTLDTVAALLLPLAEAHAVIRRARAEGSDALVSDDHTGMGRLVYDHIGENNHALARYVAWSRRIVGDEVERSVMQVASLEEYLDHPPVHIAFSGDCAGMQRLQAVLHEELGARVKQLLTLYPKQNFALLDVIHPLASKGAGLEAVAREYGLGREEVLAVGDNLNDLEMLRYAGTGVLMGNAEQSLRELAPVHLTDTNDRDGVALAIERFVLNSVDSSQ